MLQHQLPEFAVDFQYIAAGLVLTLTFQQLAARRDTAAPGTRWLGISCLSLAVVLLANVWLFKAPASQLHLALVIRTTVVMVALLVLVPTTAALTGQRLPRAALAVLLVFSLVRFVVLLTTNLLYTHEVASNGVPLPGPLITDLSAPGYALLAVVLAVMAGRWDDDIERPIFVIGLALTLGIGVVVQMQRSTVVGELLCGYWVIPLTLSLQFVKARRIATAEATQKRLAIEQAAQSAILARTERRMRLALQSGGMGWFEFDPSSRLLQKSPELDGILGLEPSGEVALVDDSLDFLVPVDRERVQLEMSLEGDTHHAGAVFRWQRPDGTTAWMETTAMAAEDEHGRVEVVGVVKDITDRKAAETELLYQARHDALTGLPNRSALTHQLREALIGGSPFSLLLLDLDGFKDVNDTLGHSVGDEVLVAVTRRLLACVRDVGVLARFGGGEFAIVLHGDEGEPEMLAARSLALFEAPFEIDGIAISMRASVGIVRAPADGVDADTLLRRADSALHIAKKRSGSFHRFTAGDDDGAARRLRLAGQIPAAIGSPQIEVHYQPTVRLADGSCSVLEALVRWRHPDDGLIPPAAFIPLAEQYGVGIPLLRRVLADSLTQCAHWRAEQLAESVAVNVSPHTLVDPSFLDCVGGALARAMLPAEALILELTENAFAEDVPAVLDTLKRLAVMGVRVAIDDFGTGYSSLSYLKRLPVHSIKLDRIFIAGIGTSRADDVIVSLTADLGRHLGLTVVAEGVETEEELETLRQLGCDVAQGFWICRPGPAGEITSWLAARSGAAFQPAKR